VTFWERVLSIVGAASSHARRACGRAEVDSHGNDARRLDAQAGPEHYPPV
jgi:hypothetical protein